MSRILKTDTHPAIQQQWDRQRATAAHILARFNDRHDVQLLGDEVGMGKTYVALAVMAERLLGSSDNRRRALLVTPASAVLRTKWEQEIRSFGDTYLDKPRRKLEPLQVTNFWDLVANLHDFQDLSPKYVTEERQACLLKVTWEWFALRRRSDRGNRLRAAWPGLSEDVAAMVRFESEFSVPAWHAFLNARNEHGQIVEMLDRGDEMWSRQPSAARGELKDLFRTFIESQARFNPNVIIAPMSALKMPRRDSDGTRKFATFVVATLLSTRWKTTRERCLKALAGLNLLQQGVTADQLQQLANLDLYNTRSCVIPAIKDAGLMPDWDAIVEGRADNIPRTFNAMLNAVVAHKVAQSRIDLAVVDEVHNWKSDTNGAPGFRAAFAPHVKCKLIMSATPFQLEEREMQRVFENVARRDDKTWNALQALYGSQTVDDCLAANEALLGALRTLTAAGTANEVFAALASTDRGPQAILTSMADDPVTEEAAASFCRAALRYRTAVDRLVEHQRELVVRHLKTDVRRSIHAGVDFGRSLASHRPTLYQTAGLHDPDDQLFNYLAMRLDQRMRREGGDATSNAHLLGGLTSSIAAFRQSAKGRSLLNRATSLSIETARYADMVLSVLDQHRHPKVEATVAHALENLRNGRKTLIFCERLDTVDEIGDRIAKALALAAAAGSDDGAPSESDVSKHHAFVDLPLARLLAPAARADDPVRRFMAETLSRVGCDPTPRRMMRLFNVFLLQKCDVPALAEMSKRVVRLFTEAGNANASSKELLGDRDGERFSGDVAGRVDAFLQAQAAGARNLWISDATVDDDTFRAGLARLLDSEARLARDAYKGTDQSRVTMGFAATLLDLEQGLKSVLLRAAAVRRFDAKGDELDARVHAWVRQPVGEGESPWGRMSRFVSQLAGANGSINTDDSQSTDRKSFWSAVSLRGTRTDDATPGGTQPAVQKLTGAIKASTRVAICAAFNSPLAPDVLVCTSIGSEGIDLHRECAEIIHHDMPWNPARLEQRNGRIDRLNSLSKTTGCHVRVGLPFLELGYERFQFDRLLSRAQLFQVLLGKLDFDAADIDGDGRINGDVERDDVQELDAEAGAAADGACALLPETLAKWLSVDLSVWPKAAAHAAT